MKRATRAYGFPESLSNVDTRQAKVILYFRMKKYYEHMHFLLNAGVSSSTVLKEKRPLLVTVNSEDGPGKHCIENTA